MKHAIPTKLAVLVLLAAGSARADQPPPFFTADRTVAISPDGRLLAYGTDSIRLVPTQPLPHETDRVIAGCGCTIEQLAFSPNGKFVMALTYVCGDPKSYTEARVWSVATGKALLTVRGPEAGDAGFLPDGELAVRIAPNRVARWSVDAHRRLSAIASRQVTFGRDGRAALTHSPIPGPPASQSSRVFIGVSPDGRRIVTIDMSPDIQQNSLVTVWDADDATKIASRPFPHTPLYYASLDGDDVLIGGRDALVHWNVQNDRAKAYLDPNSDQEPGRFSAVHITWTALPDHGAQQTSLATVMVPVTPGKKNPAFWYDIKQTFERRAPGDTTVHEFALKEK